MKRTILALTLVVSITFAIEPVVLGASVDDADLRIPSPARSLSSGDVGNQINPEGNLTSNSNGVLPYIEDPPSVNMNAIWYTMLGLLGFRA